MAMASMTLRPRVGLMTTRPSVSARRASPRVVTVKALGDTQLVISGTLWRPGQESLLGELTKRTCTHHASLGRAGRLAGHSQRVCLCGSAATAGSLALGRFVFLPFQRDNVKRQGLGKQNGVTHPEAGDKFAQEASFALNTNDPAGFNLIDVFAWGAVCAAVFLCHVHSLAADSASVGGKSVRSLHFMCQHFTQQKHLSGCEEPDHLLARCFECGERQGKHRSGQSTETSEGDPGCLVHGPSRVCRALRVGPVQT
jgi:photosystem I reaction center subunit V